MTFNKRRECLDGPTLAALVRGELPEGKLDQVQRHLPVCARCLGIVAAGVGERVHSKRAGYDLDSAVLDRPIEYGVAHLLAVLLSFVALGGSIAWWRMGAGQPGSSGEGGREHLVFPAAISRAIAELRGSPAPQAPPGPQVEAHAAHPEASASTRQ